MFNRPIVLVVGAGASHDVYGLPLGGQLASTIAKDTNFFWELQVFLRNFGSDNDLLQQYSHAAQKLSAAISSTISIDDALFQPSEFPVCVEIGKMCIMRYILAAERNSAIKIDTSLGTPTPNAGREGWIEQIFSMAITGYKLSQIKKAFENIT